MKRRSFLAMLGLSPIAAATVAKGATPDAVHVSDDAIGPLPATGLRTSHGSSLEYSSIAFRDGLVSYEPYIDVDGLVPPFGEVIECDGVIHLRSVTHHFVDAEGVGRLVWLK